MTACAVESRITPAAGAREAIASAPAVARNRRRRHWRTFTFLAAFLALWFGFLELRGLYFPDEGRYAEIPREMLASGDWLTPRVNGFPYFEKPPLQYWITAGVFAVAGEDEWTARLWPAIAALGGVIAVLLTAGRIFSRRAGWLAAALMASSCGYFLATQFLTLDMGLTGLMTCALCAFLRAQDARASPHANRGWMLAAWTLCALAVLTKGIVGVMLPALAIATYVAVQRDVALLRKLHVASGLAVLAVITLPWFILVELHNPGFAEFFFVHEHWQRFTQAAHRRPGPLWYFVPIAVVFLMPWLPALVLSTTRGGEASAQRPPAFAPRTFAWCWAAAIFVFFSMSSSKLPAYIMPAMGAVALAVAASLARRWDATIRITAWMLIGGGILLAAVAVPAATWIRVPMVHDEYVANVGWIVAGAMVFGMAGATALRLLRTKRRIRALVTLVLGVMLACQIGAVLAYRIDGYFSAERLIERLSGGESMRPFHPDVPFYSVDMFDHTVPFYLGRTVTLVKEKSEMAWGIAAAPENYIESMSEFADRWRHSGAAYAVMTPATYESLQEVGLPMRFVDSDGRRVVVARR